MATETKQTERGLWIYDHCCATEAQIRAGVDAAMDELARRGVTIREAIAGHRADVDDLPHDTAHSAAWYFAEACALTACFAGWQREPEGAYMGLA